MKILLTIFATISLTLTTTASMASDKPCIVTEASYNHILQRHCDSNVNASQFISKYCDTKAEAQNFCEMVQGSSNKVRTVQPDGRIRYDANLGEVVGTQGEKCGRLIIKPADGVVVTQFPEFHHAPGTCH